MSKIDNDSFIIPMACKGKDHLKMELYICDTNELNPHRDIKELGIVIIDKEKKDTEDFLQIDNYVDFGIEEIDRLIKFLQKAKRRIKSFNANSLHNEND